MIIAQSRAQKWANFITDNKKRALAILAGVNSLLGFVVFWILTPTGSWLLDMVVGVATLALSIFAVVLLLKAARAPELALPQPAESTSMAGQNEALQPCSLIEIEQFVDQYPPKIQALLLKALESTALEGQAVTPWLLAQLAGVVKAAIEDHECGRDPNRTTISQLSFVRRMKERRNL